MDPCEGMHQLSIEGNHSIFVSLPLIVKVEQGYFARTALSGGGFRKARCPTRCSTIGVRVATRIVEARCLFVIQETTALLRVKFVLFL